MSDIQAEFPDADREVILGAYKNAVPPFANVWGDLVRMITDITVNELDTEDISSSKVTYRTLSVLANALAQSRFLKNLVNDRLIPMGFQKKVEKLKRRLEKVCEYMIGTAPHQESKATVPNSPPLGHGHLPGYGRGRF